MDKTQGQRFKIVFMGTPEFAAVSLKHLLDWDGCDVVAVYTQPDRPCGRGRACKPSEVKVLALEHDLPVLQPENFKNPDDVAALAAFAPDLLVVAAYGLILPPAVLDAARIHAVNVHASLLPKYRGAAPIQRAIQDGQPATGITIMKMDQGMDTGDMLMQRALAIGIDDTAQTLHDELAEMGGKLLIQALERLARDELRAMPQNHDLATYAPKLSKSEGEVDWNRPAQDVHDHIRAMHPWPGAYFKWQCPDGDKTLRLVVEPGKVGMELVSAVEPGTVLGVVDDMLAVACSDRAYLTPGLTPAGKKRQTPTSFWCGYMKNCDSLVPDTCDCTPDACRDKSPREKFRDDFETMSPDTGRGPSD